MANDSNTYRWTTVIVLFLRTVEGFAYPAKMVKSDRADTTEAIYGSARVRRPGFVEHFLPSGNGRSKFARQSPVSHAELVALGTALRAGKLDKATKATLAKGWIVPADSLGRASALAKSDGPDNSTGQSLLLWAKQRVAPTGLCAGEDVSPMVVPVTMLTKSNRP